MLLGSQVLSLSFGGPLFVAALAAIPLSLIVRAASVIGPVYWLHIGNPRKRAGAAVHLERLARWHIGRAGVEPAVTPWREDLLFICYAVVVFTILVQGLTVERVIRLVFRHQGGSRPLWRRAGACRRRGPA